LVSLVWKVVQGGPLYPGALTARSAIWLKKKHHARAAADLDRSVMLQQKRAELFRARTVARGVGKADPVVANCGKAIELKAGNVFETTAQAVAKSRIDQLARDNSCGGKNDQRCL
jgi:hypothetical protein